MHRWCDESELKYRLLRELTVALCAEAGGQPESRSSDSLFCMRLRCGHRARISHCPDFVGGGTSQPTFSMSAWAPRASCWVWRTVSTVRAKPGAVLKSKTFRPKTQAFGSVASCLRCIAYSRATLLTWNAWMCAVRFVERFRAVRSTQGIDDRLREEPNFMEAAMW